jgi:hypothetical protein
VSAADLERALAAAAAPGACLAAERAATHAVDGIRPRFVAAPTTVEG